jgi:hypothetical protein
LIERSDANKEMIQTERRLIAPAFGLGGAQLCGVNYATGGRRRRRRTRSWQLRAGRLNLYERKLNI